MKIDPRVARAVALLALSLSSIRADCDYCGSQTTVTYTSGSCTEFFTYTPCNDSSTAYCSGTHCSSWSGSTMNFSGNSKCYCIS